METVGKSSLTYRLIDCNFPTKHDPTITDQFSAFVNIDKENAHIAILDTAGQGDYQSLLDTWIDFGEGFLLVFAINDKTSFNELDKRKSKIDLIKKNKNTPVVLIGNKSDLKDSREVSKEEAEKKAKTWGTVYIETSALENVNCKEAFIECAKRIKEKRKFEEQQTSKNDKRKEKGGNNKEGIAKGINANEDSSVKTVNKKCCVIF